MAIAIVVVLTQANIDYSHIYLGRHRDFFPAESIGAASREQGEGRPLRLHVAGTQDPIETDIAGDKMIFRRRDWCADLFRSCRLKASDAVVIEKLSDNEYEIYPKWSPRLAN